MILTGTNTYTNVTTINSRSTLQLGNGGTTGSIVGNVVNNGTLAFNRSERVPVRRRDLRYRRAPAERHRHDHPHRRQHLRWRHDHQRRHAATRQRRRRRLDRRQRRQQRHARLQPLGCLHVRRHHVRHRCADTGGHRKPHPDRQPHLHRQHDRRTPARCR